MLPTEWTPEKVLLFPRWLQQQEGKLEKSRKEAKRDAETIAIIGEDAEEADAEAAMALCTSDLFSLI